MLVQDSGQIIIAGNNKSLHAWTIIVINLGSAAAGLQSDLDGGFALPGGLAVPSLTGVLNWAAAILDAHFLTLAAQPVDALQTLLGLQGSVAEDLRVSQRVASLGGALTHINRQAPLPNFSSAAAHTYSVELLDLSVRNKR